MTKKQSALQISEFKLEEPEESTSPEVLEVIEDPGTSSNISPDAQEILRQLNESERKRHMKKRFQSRWIGEFEGLIRPVPDNENRFFCLACNYEYSITTMGRAAVLTHLSTMTHQQNMKEFRERNPGSFPTFIPPQQSQHHLPGIPTFPFPPHQFKILTSQAQPIPGSALALVSRAPSNQSTHTPSNSTPEMNSFTLDTILEQSIQAEEKNDDDPKQLKNMVEKLKQQLEILNKEKTDFHRKSLTFESLYHREAAKTAILEGELAGYKNACQKLQEALDKTLSGAMNL